MSPRIMPVSDPSEAIAEVLSKTLLRDVPPLNMFATLAHHPQLLKRYSALWELFLRYGDLPSRERELVILRMGWRTGSDYMFARHSLIGHDAGLSHSEIAALATTSGRPWTASDRALVTMVDELWEFDRIGDSCWAELSERWSSAQMIELVMLAGFYRMTAGFLNSVGVELEPGVQGRKQRSVAG